MNVNPWSFLTDLPTELISCQQSEEQRYVPVCQGHGWYEDLVFNAIWTAHFTVPLPNILFHLNRAKLKPLNMKRNPLSESLNTPFKLANGLLWRERDRERAREQRWWGLGMCWMRATSVCLFPLSVFGEDPAGGTRYVFPVIVTIFMTVISPGSHYR